MDSNHRRHSQQIYSLPPLATWVTYQPMQGRTLSHIAAALSIVLAHGADVIVILFGAGKKLASPPGAKKRGRIRNAPPFARANFFLVPKRVAMRRRRASFCALTGHVHHPIEFYARAGFGRRSDGEG